MLLWPGEEVDSDDIIRIDDLTLNLATYQAQVAGGAVGGVGGLSEGAGGAQRGEQKKGRQGAACGNQHR